MQEILVSSCQNAFSALEIKFVPQPSVTFWSLAQILTNLGKDMQNQKALYAQTE